jgi:threonine/homoserine/homoserine lactone efflux protein
LLAFAPADSLFDFDDSITVMFGAQNLPLFLLSAILLNLTPGQDTLYIVGRTIAQGRRAGLLSAAGIIAGCVVHTLAAGFGLSAVLATWAAAFIAVKLAGAIYLVYLGVRMLLDPAINAAEPETLVREPAWPTFRAGFFTNVLNPKVALFYLAFLPQFVDPAAGHKIVAFLFLGALFIMTGTLWCLVLVSATSAGSRHLRTSAPAGKIIKRATGALFVGLGLKLAVSR